MIHYGMTKTAQLAVSRGLAQSCAGTAVTVNAVLPGPTHSAGVEEFAGKLSGGKPFAEFEAEFFKNFYNTDLQLGKRVSEQTVQSNWNVAAGSSAAASLACVSTWLEDFRLDLTRIDVPTLVIHGDADRILPIAASGLRTGKLIKDARMLVVKDGPHCITWTHADEVNRALLNFLGE